MVASATADVPAGPEELWRDYYGLALSIVRNMGVAAQESEDVASTIMTKLIESDIISMYRPDKVSEHTGSNVSFRSFLAANVSIRVRGQRDRLARLAGHEALICDSRTDEGTTWVELFGGSWWDDHSYLDAAEFVARMRTWLALQPPRSDLDRCDLVRLFDEMVREIEAGGKVSYPDIQERFGVGYTTARTYVARVRQAILDGQERGAITMTWTIGGVVLGITEVREAVTILRSKLSTNVLLPLRHHNHPLGACGDWYHEFAAQETELYPELAKPKGSRQKHFGKVKGAVIHRLERMLAEVVSPPEPEQFLAEPLAVVIPPPLVADGEDPLSPAELLENILWQLHADAGTVQQALALAVQVTAA
jgi:hypothetical protein